MLSGSGLTKHFVLGRSMLGRPTSTLVAVDEVDISVRPREAVGVVGESGSGKSTLARLLAHLVEPTSGSVSVLGRTIGTGRDDRRWLRRNVQVILQDPYSSLDPTKTVGHAIREPLVVQGIGTREERSERCGELLVRVGLDPTLADRYPEELSGGQRQRVAIARALATRPAVIIADEPTSALDLSTRSEILNLLLELQEREGLALLVISHDFATVQHLAHRLVVMYNGRIVEEGPTLEVVSAPVHPYTRALMSAVPLPNPSLQRDRRRIPLRAEAAGMASWDSCAFLGRCADVLDECARSAAPVVDVAEGHVARCHRAASRVP